MNRTANVGGTRAALGDAVAALLDAPVRLASAVNGGLALRQPQGCDIPAPCWEPRLVGTCHLELAPGATATVRVHVLNCAWTRQVVTITATGRLAAVVKLEPTTMILEPQAQATFRVLVHLPEKVPTREMIAGALMVHGCLDHFARVTVRAAECTSGDCCDLQVRDCPDHVHHWYDHFYCPRPCRNSYTREAVSHG